MTKVFIPRDAAALSMGADAVAKAIAEEAEKRMTPVEIVRTGSRGMLWLEPLVEVETPERARRLWAGDARRRARPLQGEAS